MAACRFANANAASVIALKTFRSRAGAQGKDIFQISSSPDATAQVPVFAFASTDAQPAAASHIFDVSLIVFLLLLSSF